ncbi:glycogen synthase [Jatrophihabitans sp.]|uniref:glycogen synthase n=1 Tax=Jatrophihabitans sp. TaxID=1932789 RepID=UPI0030C72C07|nr:glycogen synthase [Jatrophihabitans sp.]
MRVAILSREYPPEVYGGAGVHVEFLVRELRRVVDVEVHCFGAPRDEPGVHAYATPPGLGEANAALRTLGVDLEIAAALGQADVVHSHTWYANLAGVLAAQLHGVPHVLTAHSLEPQRPWKAEQLGGGYQVSSWAERQAYETADAIVAVSYGMRADVLEAYPFVDPRRVHVIHNGIDTTMYAPAATDAALDKYGIDRDRPYAIFVGRITRQKGLAHLVAAARHLDPAIQLVLCAGAPDTAEIATEIADGVAELGKTRSGVVWVQETVPRPELVELLTHATVFVCPSIYEPLGIVNLEAMACETAVVASAVGGIPEVVADGLTGVLVPCSTLPAEEFEAGLASAINELCADPERAARLGRSGRERAVREFGWDAIAHRTVELYDAVIAARQSEGGIDD